MTDNLQKYVITKSLRNSHISTVSQEGDIICATDHLIDQSIDEIPGRTECTSAMADEFFDQLDREEVLAAREMRKAARREAGVDEEYDSDHCDSDLNSEIQALRDAYDRLETEERAEVGEDSSYCSDSSEEYDFEHYQKMLEAEMRALGSYERPRRSSIDSLDVVSSDDEEKQKCKKYYRDVHGIVLPNLKEMNLPWENYGTSKEEEVVEEPQDVMTTFVIGTAFIGNYIHCRRQHVKMEHCWGIQESQTGFILTIKQFYNYPEYRDICRRLKVNRHRTLFRGLCNVVDGCKYRVNQMSGLDADDEWEEEEDVKTLLAPKLLRIRKIQRDLHCRAIKETSEKGWRAFCYEMSRRSKVFDRILTVFKREWTSERMYIELSQVVPPEWRMMLRSIVHNRTAVDFCVAYGTRKLVRSYRVQQGALPPRNSAGFVEGDGFFTNLLNLGPMMKVFVDASRSVEGLMAMHKSLSNIQPGYIMRIILSCLQLSRAFAARDWWDVGLALGQLGLVPGVVKILKSAVVGLGMLFQLEENDSSNRIPQGGPNIFLSQSELYSKLHKFLCLFVNSSLFESLPLAMRIHTNSVTYAMTQVISESLMLESFLSFLKSTMEKCIKFGETGDYFVFLSGDKNIDKLHIIEEAMIMLTGPGRNTLMLEKPTRWNQIEELSDRMCNALHELEVKQNPALVTAILQLRREVLAVRRGSNVTRQAPYGLIIKGDPGTGKTMLVSMIENQVRATWQVPQDVSVTLTLQPDSKFQIQPSMTLLVHLSDAFQIKDDKCLIPTMSLLQSLVDTTLVKLEGASIEEKERSVLAPDVVVATTNVSRYSMTSSTGGANKLDRRFDVLEVEWTDMAKEKAKIGKYDVSRTLSRPEVTSPSGYVKYTVGRMSNGEGAVLDLSIAEVIMETTNIKKVLRYIRERRSTIKAIGDPTVVLKKDLCIHGLPNPCECLCPLENLGKQIVPYEAHEGDVEDVEYREVQGGLMSLSFCPRRKTKHPSGREWTPEEDEAYKSSKFLMRELFTPPATEPDFATFYGTFVYRRLKFLIGHDNFSVYRACVEDNLTKDLWYIDERNEKILRVRYIHAETRVESRFDFDRWSDYIILDTYHVRPNLSQFFWMKWYELGEENQEHFRNACVFGASAALGYITVGLVLLQVVKTYEKSHEEQGNLHGKIVGVPNIHSDQPVLLGQLPEWLGRPEREDKTLPVVIEVSSSKGAMFCVFIALNVIMLPKHFFIYSKDETDCMKAGERFEVGMMPMMFNPACLYKFDKLDLCAYFVGPVNGAWKSVWEYLPDDVIDLHHKPAEFQKKAVNVISVLGPEYIYQPMVTVKGDCGKLLMYEGKVVGLHIAALCPPNMEAMGVAVALSRKLLGPCFEKFVKDGRIPVQLDDQKPQGYPTLSDENLVNTDMNWCMKLSSEKERYFADTIPLGCLRQRDTTKMTCHETSMFGVFGHKCGKYVKAWTGRATPVVDPDGKVTYVSPVTRRFDVKVGEKPFDGVLMDFVVEEAVNELPEPLQHAVPLTWFDVMVGHPDSFLINPKDYSKSVGPLNSLQGRRASMAFTKLKGEEGFEVANWIYKRMLQLEATVVRGRVPITLTKATIKDEPQTVEKFLIAKSRLFNVIEPELNMLLKKYIKPIMVYCLLHSNITGFKLVINPAGTDWDELAEQFLRFGVGQKNLFDADHVNFDLRHSGVIQYVFRYIMLVAEKLRYGVLAKFMLGVLLETAFRSVQIIENVFYLVMTRLQSGLDLTSFFNCIANTLLNRMCTRKALRLCGKDDSFPIRSAMFDATNGDDLGMAVAPFLKDFLSGEFLVKECGLVGYKMTGGEKTEVIPRWKNIEEITFVKRRFKRHEGRWKAPLALESIYKSLSYSCQSTVSQEERDKGALLCAYKEMWLHGPEQFEEFKQMCIGAGLVVKEYESFQEDYDNNTCFPWSPDDEIAQNGSGKDYTSVLRDNPFLVEQLLSEQTVEPHLYRVIQGSSPTEASSRTGASRFISSTELNDTNNTIPHEDHSPVNKINANDGDSVALYNPNFLTKESREESLDAFFARPRRLATFDVTTAAVGSATVTLFSTWSALPGVAKQISQYRLWRGAPTFKVIYSGNPSTLGYVRVVAVPTIEADNYTAEIQTVVSPNSGVSFTRSSTMPYIDFDLSKPCCCEMKLPFPSQFDYRLTTVNDWTLFFVELGPMASADTAITPAAVTFEVYVHYDNMQFLALVPQMSEGGGPWQKFLSYSSYILSLIPHPYATVASKLAGAGSAFAGAMGWSRPMLEATEAMIMRKHGNTAIASGQSDMVFHAGLDPAVGSNVLWTQYPLGREDDMSVRRMTEMYGQLQKAWTGAAFTCDPSFNATSTYVSGTVIYPTPLNFASFLFNYWRGELIYKLVIYSSPLIRWRIAVVVVPNGVVAPAVYSGAADYLTTIVDVVGTTEVEIVVPYLHRTPWLAPSRQTAIGTNGGTRLMYFQLAAPSGPGTTTATPIVDVWVKGGKDFEMAQPTLDYVNLFRTSQMGPARAAYNFGEVVDNWGLLCKRPVQDLNGAVAATRGVGGRLSLPMDGVGPIDTAEVGVAGHQVDVYDSGWSYASYLRRAYIGYNGGTTHRFVWANDATPSRAVPRFANVFQRNEAFGSNSKPGATTITEQSYGTGDLVFTTDDFMVETGFPSRANANFKNPQKQDVVFTSTQECLSIYLPELMSTETFGFVHITSALDDFTMGGLIMIPALKVR